jgi:phospholipid/cholesterol/gamma-HCH transport system permease protein
MVVTEQVDALRMSGVDPVDFLVAPRFTACVVMTLVMSVFGVLIAYAAGGFTAASSFSVSPAEFFSTARVGMSDLAIGLAKATSYGVAIPSISGFCGLRAHGSSEGVGAATTSAVIGSSFAVIALDFVISGLSFAFGPGVAS